MSAAVYPFPLTRQQGRARRHAELMRGMRDFKACEHLERQLRLQREIMEKRGISPAIIEVELSGFAAQVRAEYARGCAHVGGVA